MANKKAKKWQPVSIGSQFTLIRGRESKSTIQEEGDLPFVSAKKTNNGYRMFVNTSKTVVNGNTISLNNNGDGGAGFGYYQPYKYTIDVNTTALIPKDNMCFNKHIGLFWSGCFTWMHDFFGNARTLSNQRAFGTQIMVPINEAGQPDCEFMAEYSKEKQKELLSRYKGFSEKQTSKIESKKIPSLEEKEWTDYSITSLFNTLIAGKGKGLNHLHKTTKNGISYIGATNRNNGVLCFVSEDDSSQKMLLPGNCIGFIKNGDGSAGFAIYKAESFVSTSDVIYGYSDWINKYTGLFFVAAQDMIERKYSHGYKRKNPDLQTVFSNSIITP